jgi:hypothetical protein
MHPNTYVSEEFFNLLDEEYKNLPQLPIYSVSKEYEEKLVSICRIRDLLLGSNIYSDISDKSAIKYHNKQFGTYFNLKDQILHTKVKDASYATRPILRTRQSKEKCDFNGFCYFTNKDSKDCIEESNKTGKIIIGKDFLKTPFYIKNTFATESTDEKIFQIKRSKHPCRGLLIIDQYLFNDTPKRQPKIPNLISFLEELIPQDLTNKFEIDIITAKHESPNDLFQNKYDQLLNAFGSTISLHIYASPKMNDENDRYLITNYAVFSIGHPFDRKSNVSCNFYPSNNNIEDIHFSYKLWREKIEFAKSIIKTTPLNFGVSKAIWKSDEIEHNIFDIKLE